MTWPEAIGIAIAIIGGGEALFQGGLLAIRYIERHEMQKVIAIANSIELTGEEGVWRGKALSLVPGCAGAPPLAAAAGN